MNLLYAYRYGIVGGVSTQLLLRQQAMRQQGHRCDLFFSQDNGLRAVLPLQQGVYFGADHSYRSLVRRGSYDHVVVIDTPELLSQSFPAWWQPSRQVWLDVHTTTVNGLAYLNQLDAGRLAGVMVPTHYSASLVAKRLPGTTPHVLPNVLDHGVFSLQSEHGGEDSAAGARHFIWVGKLDAHKNWRLALIYARMLKELFGTVQLTMVGGYTAPAETGEALFELAGKLELLDSLRWIDRIDNQALAALYRRCGDSGGAMLVTSRDESFGMAAAEALMCGCPLITNDLPVFREVFPDSDMIKRVDIWQPEQFEQAAKALLAVPDQETCRHMYEHLSSTYGPAAFMAALNAALEA
ncbi:glycosyltransferase family 4 protein [Ectopseudomonas oleovorans]|uniref:glycosyltransferase family 4 protein n=1 Tax=Ectopseudomonas oleovorans TaxID=301 RepID=UPI000CF0601B|nr:glycosyltransferase [Pseudomonas oleovorans]PPV33955.1 glycosyl transferase [Pseudomonas oleovorans]